MYISNGEEMSFVINKFEKLFTEDWTASKKQKNICDFFKPLGCNEVLLQLLNLFKETVKTVKTLCNVSVNF